MTTQNDFTVERRNVLKTIGLGIGLGTIGTSWMSLPVRAATGGVNEVLYLVDNGSSAGAPSTLYSVDLVDDSPAVADLTLLGEFVDMDNEYTYVASHIACTPDGSTIYAVNANQTAGPGIRLGAWDVDDGTFSDIGSITGMPDDARVTQAAISPDGRLYVIDVENDKLHEVQDYASSPSVGSGYDVTVDVEGGDIVFDSEGTLYCYSLAPNKLLVIDPATGNVTEQLGTDLQSFTGLAIRDAGEGLLVGSRNKSSSPNPNSVIELDPADGSVDTVYAMKLGGNDFAHTFGDMSVGPLAPTCEECESDELLAKYEFDCVETVDDECVAYDFILENGDADLVGYEAGSFASKDGEAFEPVSATFGTEFCSLWQVAKAGQDFVVQELTADNDEVTVTTGDSKHAISFVAFFCTETAANEFAESFPPKGRGRGR